MISHHLILNVALGIALGISALGVLWLLWSIHSTVNKILQKVDTHAD